MLFLRERSPDAGATSMRLAIVLFGSVLLLPGVGHALTARVEHIPVSAGHLYPALMAIAPIGIVLLFLLGERFPGRKMTCALGGAFAVIFLGAFVGARTQTRFEEADFAHARLSLHAQAPARCGRPSLQGRRLVDLCRRPLRRKLTGIAEPERILAEP